jgi:peptide-methionine (S)-S-oxide reductase
MKNKLNLLSLVLLTILFNSNLLQSKNKEVNMDNLKNEKNTFIVAGGCFWCIETDFLKLKGVIDTEVGYIGGDSPNPTYEGVSSQKDKGYYEGMKVYYDANVLSYEDLLDYFFKHIDPTDGEGQFCDRGLQYSTAIFYNTKEEEAKIKDYIAKLDDSKILPDKVKTKLIYGKKFWIGEDYHQKYAKKNPIRYKYYRTSCGRDKRVAEVWSKLKDVR